MLVNGWRGALFMRSTKLVFAGLLAFFAATGPLAEAYADAFNGFEARMDGKRCVIASIPSSRIE